MTLASTVWHTVMYVSLIDLYLHTKIWEKTEKCTTDIETNFLMSTRTKRVWKCKTDADFQAI